MRRACTCCPARSTSTCISATPAIPTRRISAPAPRARRSAASPPCSTCPTPCRRPAPAKSSPRSTPSPPPRRMSISGSTACSARTPSPTCRDLVAGGVIGFKLYMGNTFGNIPSPSTGAMLEAFEVVAATGKRISLHAETATIMARREARMAAAGRHDPLAHLAARPAVVAVEAVSRAAILAEWTGARIHILHISSAEELRPLAEAKARGVDITGETCPHYLMLSQRRLCALGRRHPRQSAGARGAQPGAAVAGARRRHRRHDRHRPRAAFAGGEDQERHLVGRLRLSRRRDADAADAHRGGERPLLDLATTCAGAPPIPPRCGGSIRGRA